jgi:hypothetical protein
LRSWFNLATCPCSRWPSLWPPSWLS